ncbi:MAG: hypothetical protein Q6363_004625 [Candidatus Njordarchaeota archaeon]
MGDKEYMYIYLLLIVLTIPFLTFCSWVISLISNFLIIPLIIVARFLAGFGFLGTLFAGVTYIFKIIPKDYRKKKHAKTIVKTIVVIVLIVMFAMPTIEAINLILGRTKISLLGLLAGIYSFIFTMYIIPVWKKEKAIFDEGLLQKISKSLSGIKRKLKKAYYRYFTRDLIKAYSLDFLYLKARLDEYKIKTAWKLLPAIIILLASIPTMAIIATIAAWRIIKNKTSNIDRILFISTIVVAATYVLFVINLQNISTYFWGVPYIIGSVISILLFVDAIIGILR